MKPRRLRVLVLPLAAIVIFAAVEYRLRQPVEPKPQTSASYGAPLEAPPPLEGTDSNNNYFRLDRYLGRQEVIVVFFDRAKGANGDPVLAELKKQTQTLKSRGIFVVAVSSALPQENRKAGFETPIPFVFVTDTGPDQIWKYHRPWGCLDEDAGTAIPTAFFIDRAGRTQMRDGKPVPITPKDVSARFAGASE
jgi:peroxiredoxin